MKVSIITPVFNAVNTLETTIMSVLSQTVNAEIEYILVDGRSTDGSLEIIHRYAHRIAKVISEPDTGVYDAMNKGVALATGEIIGIINADDWYQDHCLQHIVDAFDQSPDAGIVYAPLLNYFNGQYRNTFIPGKLENLAFKFTLNHPTCFVRKCVYEQVGSFDLNYSIAADYDFVLRAYQAGIKFCYIEIPLVAYSMDGISGRVSNRLKLIRESWNVSQKLASTLPRGGQIRRCSFYTSWIVKDILLIPIKKIVKPHTINKIKDLIRRFFGRLPADEYGAW